MFSKYNNIYHCNNIIESVAIKIPIVSSTKKNLIVGAFYRPPGSTLSKHNWQKLLDSVYEDESWSIIGGDANAHSSAWDLEFNCRFQNSCLACKTGSNLLEILDETDSDLVIANNGSATYMNSSLGEAKFSALDLTLMSSSLFLDSSWNVYDDLMNSDHIPINISINNSTKNVPFVMSHKINTKNIDWKRYKLSILEAVQKDFPNKNSFSIQPPTQQYEYLSNTLINTISYEKKQTHNFNHNDHLSPDTVKNSFYKSYKLKKNMPPWWSEECVNLVKERRKASNEVLKKPSIEKLNEYEKTVVEAKHKLKEIKIKSFKNYVEKELSRESDIKNVWNVIKKFKNRTILKNKNNETGNNIDLAKNMLDFIHQYSHPADTSLVSEYVSFESETRSVLNDCNNYLDNPFTMDELELAISALKTNTSPGLDKVTNEMILNTPINYRILLLHTFNVIFKTYFYPIQWSNTISILIPKDDSNKKFRPLALTSCLSKLFERMILIRLSHFFEKNNILPETQNCFRKGRSCTHSLMTLVTNILNNYIDNKPLVAVLLDIRSAFDNVLPYKLQEVLKHFNIPIYTRKFIHKLMVKRLIYFKVLDKIEGPYIRNAGVPQGRVLSPLLYNIYIVFLSSILRGNNCILQLADDTIIYNKDLPIKESIQSLQDNLSVVDSFFDEYGLPIAPEKNKLIVFDRTKSGKPTSYKIKFKNSIIYGSDSVKYLGMVLDSRLSWQLHTKYILEKARKLLNIIKVLRVTWWGGQPQVLINVYKGLIRSTIEYNIFLLTIYND